MIAQASVSRLSVHRARPSGAGVQALAMIAASTSPSAFSLAVSEFGLLFGVTAGSSPSVQYFLRVSITTGTETPAPAAICFRGRDSVIVLLIRSQYDRITFPLILGKRLTLEILNFPALISGQGYVIRT